jgi:hypothetical protein
VTLIKTDVQRVMSGKNHTIAFRVTVPDHLAQSAMNQMKFFARCMEVYAERNHLYRDNWIRMGWRGCLIRVKERVERLWDAHWENNVAPVDPSVDDCLDLANFAGFMARGLEGETTRGGEWWPKA